MPEIRCTSCSRRLRVQSAWNGKTVMCPQCSTRQKVVLPDDSSSPAPTASSAPSAGAPVSRGPTSFDIRTPSFHDEAYTSREPDQLKRGSDLNPYAAPVLPPDDLQLHMVHWVRTQVGPLDFIERTWKLLIDNLGPCLLVGLVLLAQGGVAGAIGQAIVFPSHLSHNWIIIVAAHIISALFNMAVSAFFQIGAIKFGLKLCRGQNAEVRDLFSGLPQWLPGYLLMLAMLFVFYGILLILETPALYIYLSQGGWEEFTRNPFPVVISAMIGALLWLPIVAVLSMNWILALPMLVDKKLGFMDAFRASTTYMRGNRLTGFTAFLIVGTFGGVIVMCTFFVGSIAYLPYLALLPVVMYLLVTGQPIVGLATPQPLSAQRPVNDRTA